MEATLPANSNANHNPINFGSSPVQRGRQQKTYLFFRVKVLSPPGHFGARRPPRCPRDDPHKRGASLPATCRRMSQYPAAHRNLRVAYRFPTDLGSTTRHRKTSAFAWDIGPPIPTGKDPGGYFSNYPTPCCSWSPSTRYRRSCRKREVSSASTTRRSPPSRAGWYLTQAAPAAGPSDR